MCTTHSFTIDTSVQRMQTFGIVYAAPSNENEVKHFGSSAYACETWKQCVYDFFFSRETFPRYAFLSEWEKIIQNRKNGQFYH